MQKAIVTILIIVGALALIAFIYFKYLKTDTGSSTVNSGSESNQTKRQYLNRVGMSNKDIDDLVKISGICHSCEQVNSEIINS